MKRLTEHTEYGTVRMHCDNCRFETEPCCDSADCVTVLKNKLANYEDLGYDPEELKGIIERTSSCSDERLKTIIDHFGEQRQIIKAAEECAELSQALLKYVNGGYEEHPTNGVCNIRTETADVEIMLEQLKLIFGGDNKLKEFKIQRTLNRINDETRRNEANGN